MAAHAPVTGKIALPCANPSSLTGKEAGDRDNFRTWHASRRISATARPRTDADALRAIEMPPSTA